MNDYEIMNTCRAKWLRELPGSDPTGTLALAAYARGFMDALEVALAKVIADERGGDGERG